MHRVEVSLQTHLPDARGQGLVKDIADLGITSVKTARIADIYYIDGDLSTQELETICRRALTDPLIQNYAVRPGSYQSQPDGKHSFEVTFNPGVTDPIEESILKSIRDLSITGVEAVKTATRYELFGSPTEAELNLICSRLLVNPTVQHVVTSELTERPGIPEYHFELKTVAILGVEHEALAATAARLGFSETEMAAIRNYFTGLGRNPTDAELETLAQTWSEHCGHKTFKARYDFNGTVINGLLKSTIMRATRELDKSWCLSVFEDNAGVISFDDDWALAFKVETHNHPSAIEPYGGAATGVGGVVRDVLGTGLAAKPIANTDVFCFGKPDMPYEKLPEGSLHPRRIFKGVRAGVADYGNRLGIPTVNGAVLFDERYTANPLVYCGTVGIMPRRAARMGQQQPGDLVVLIGGKTGRDGIHGVTFASTELNYASTEECQSSVQIGNAIAEKKVIDAVLEAREKKLFRRITDCGGGGLSSAVGEMAESTGVRVHLDKVPLKYAGLNYTEIWISESQERMLLAVPPECIDELARICRREGTEATVIGEFTDDRLLQLYYGETLVCRLDMQFLHEGLPRLDLKAAFTPIEQPDPAFEPPAEMGSMLKQVLSSWNTCSREWLIRQYDHEVQGGSVLKPLGGKNNDGPQDAAVIKPVPGSPGGVIISNGINPSYGDIDPYWMAASAIEEALRQIIAVGGNLKRVALLDNFSWGSAKRPDSLGALVRACQACYDLATVYETPFISGKDSLNNEYEHEGRIISIPHTLLISAIAVMEDASRVISSDFKSSSNLVYLIGNTADEMGGSEYYKVMGLSGGRVPRVLVLDSLEIMQRLSTATEKGMVASCHDLSDGGLGAALAEMAFAGGLGASIELIKVPRELNIKRDDVLLFSQSNSRFLCEVEPGNAAEFEKLMSGVDFACIGRVECDPHLLITGMDGKELINESIDGLKEAWQKPLRW